MTLPYEYLQYIYAYYNHDKELTDIVPKIYQPKELRRRVEKFEKELKSNNLNEFELKKAIKRLSNKVKLHAEGELSVSKMSNFNNSDLVRLLRQLEFNYKNINLTNLTIKSSKDYSFSDKAKLIRNNKILIKNIYTLNYHTREIKKYKDIKDLMLFMNKELNVNPNYSVIRNSTNKKILMYKTFYIRKDENFNLNELFPYVAYNTETKELKDFRSIIDLVTYVRNFDVNLSHDRFLQKLAKNNGLIKINEFEIYKK